MSSSASPLSRATHPFGVPQAYCTETFEATKLAPVVGQGLAVPELQEGCERIMNLLRLNFYLLDYAVESDLSRGLITASGGEGGFVESNVSLGLLLKILRHLVSVYQRYTLRARLSAIGRSGWHVENTIQKGISYRSRLVCVTP